jgi:hypothetical protein
MLNQLMAYQVDDDMPNAPDPSHDDLWSAQAKRYQRLLLEQDVLKKLNPAVCCPVAFSSIK